MGTNADEVRQVAARGYWRESDARLLIEAWRSSGETLVRFARRHRVEHKRLARWVSRLDAAGRGRLLLHPVRLVDNRLEAGAPIEIQFAGGRRVRVPPGFASEDLRRVLAVLAESAPC
jgi:transposase